MVLPFAANQDEQVRLFVSLLLRPLVCPATGRDPQKSMEIRFFAPGSLVSNLDFVEGIFGNGGDPYLPENDAALDAMHWTGHTGCVILAPHLAGIMKKDLGLPHESEATERQRRDGMFWRDPHEPYNGGGAFKVACRDARGVMVTIIADNYYGYCKKEVKTQISFAANLYGMAEEEHAGGAIAFATYVLGQDFHAGRTVSLEKSRFGDAMRAARTDGGAEARRLRRGPALPGYSLRAGRRALQRARRHDSLGKRRRGTQSDAAARNHLRAAVRFSRAHGKAGRAARPGEWWARGRAARCVTNRARFPAAENRRSPNPSPT